MYQMERLVSVIPRFRGNMPVVLLAATTKAMWMAITVPLKRSLVALSKSKCISNMAKATRKMQIDLAVWTEMNDLFKCVTMPTIVAMPLTAFPSEIQTWSFLTAVTTADLAILANREKKQ